MEDHWCCYVVSFGLLFMQVNLGKGQELQAGMSCAGEKYDLCAPSLVCAEDDVCRADVGGPCRVTSDCKSGLSCSSNVCAVIKRRGEDCSEYPCDSFNVCDVTSTCRGKIGSGCTHSSDIVCSAGGDCIKVYERRFGRRCVCTDGVSTQDGYICKPLPGKILGACVNETACDDQFAYCDQSTKICQCQAGTTLDPETFSCDLNAGQSCEGKKKKLCVKGTTCGDDGICRLVGGMSCAGNMSNLCAQGTVCIDDICMADYGEINPAAGGRCRPGSDFANYVCWMNIGENCKEVKDWCYSRVYKNGGYIPALCDPVTDTCRLLVNRSRCIAHSECPPGAMCVSYKCQCIYSGESFAPNKKRVCGLPRGAVGAQCSTAQNPTGCVDPNAKCRNKTELCVCKTGYDEDLNRASCVLSGPKCTLYGRGVINTFFNMEMDVVLGCRFRVAEFKCGGAEVEVFATKSQSTVAEVTVNLQRKTPLHSYVITSSGLVSSGSWNKTCLSEECKDDRRVEATVTSGQAILQRDLLKITYRTSYLHIECGHSKFKGRSSYPDALCGSPTDTETVVSDFRREMELESKADMPDTFGYMSDRPFRTRRMSDRAILYNQNVTQSDPLCAEASSIVSGDCPARVENMYNCSHVIDNDHFIIPGTRYNLHTYLSCFGSTINPMQVYVSCLRMMCDRNNADISAETCQTLQEVVDRCDRKVGTGVSIYWQRPRVPFTKLGELLEEYSECPRNTTTTA